MKTKIQGLNQLASMIRSLNIPHKVDTSDVHILSREYENQIIDEQYLNRKIVSQEDIVREFKTLYIGNWLEHEVAVNDFKVESKSNKIDMRMSGGYKTIGSFNISKEQDLKEIFKSPKWKDISDKASQKLKISQEEYNNNILYSYRMYDIIFNNFNDKVKVQMEFKGSKVYITYTDITKFNMIELIKEPVKVDDYEIDTAGLRKLALVNKNIAIESDIQYIQGKEESCISLNSGLFEEPNTKFIIPLSIIAMPEILAVIDTVYLKYGISNIDMKYLLEEVMLNIMYHNFRKGTDTTMEIKENFLPLFGNSNKK